MSLQTNENNPDDLFSFSGSVGRSGDNDRADVIKAQALLANAGYYDLPEPGMPTGWPGGELNRALTRFQKDHGLEPDGILLPLDEGGVPQNGMGETLFTLQDKLGDRLKDFAPPSVQDVDDFYRLRPSWGGEGEPHTDVYLRSGKNDGGEPVGLKPIHVMSDEAPDEIELKPGQKQALLAPTIQVGARVIPQIPNLLRGLGILAPAASLPLSGDEKRPTDNPITTAYARHNRRSPKKTASSRILPSHSATASSSPRMARSCMSRRLAPGPTSSTRKSGKSPMPSTMRSPKRWRCISAEAGAIW